jgi:hypothetical protein
MKKMMYFHSLWKKFTLLTHACVFFPFPVQVAEDLPLYFAERLMKYMKGLFVHTGRGRGKRCCPCFAAFEVQLTPVLEDKSLGG